MSGAAPLRVMALSAIGLLLISSAGYLIWDHISQLHEQVADLGQRLEETESEAAAAQKRAEVAESRAAAANARAIEANRRADEAEEHASQSAEQRHEAEQARRQAEEETAQARTDAATARQEAEEARAEAERIRREREAELDRLQQALEKIVETRRTALGLVMNLGEDRIRFDFDRAELRPEARELLSRIVGVLLTSPEGYMVQVFGHTDDVGPEEYNQKLSERRAQSVHDYLIEAGIPEQIIVTRGFGESSPLVEATDPVSRQRNRRVEIGIIDTVVEYQGAKRSRRPQR